MGEVVETIPKMGLTMEKLEYIRLKFNVWDLLRQRKIRILWKHYYQNTNALIFIIDSTNQERIEEAAEKNS